MTTKRFTRMKIFFKTFKKNLSYINNAKFFKKRFEIKYG